MRRNLIVLGLLAGLAGCTTDPLPEGYLGPAVTIFDSSTPRGSTGADFFYLSAYNGKDVYNSVMYSRAVNYGQGMSMHPALKSHSVLIASATFTIEGKTDYGAPILAFINKIYHVKGTFTFTPEEHHSYVVMGELNDEHSVVWMEDYYSHDVVSPKFEVNGKSTLEIFQK